MAEEEDRGKMEPGSERLMQVLQQPYDKIMSRADMCGELYEVKLATLLFLRGLNETDGFCMATNMDGVGSYDDIVFRCWKKSNNHMVSKTYLVQLKHKKTKKLAYSQLTSSSGDFSLPKHCENSYCITKNAMSLHTNHPFLNNDIENCEFVLYTNAELGSGWKLPQNVADILEDSSLDQSILMNDANIIHTSSILNTGGYILAFYQIIPQSIETVNDFNLLDSVPTVDQHSFPDIYNALSNLPDCTEFLSKCRLYFNQSNVDGLNDFIIEEIKKACRLNRSDADLFFPVVLARMQTWWKDGFNYLTEKNKDEILGTAEITMKQIALTQLSQQEMKKIVDFGVNFFEDHLQCMSNAISKHDTLHIMCNSSDPVVTTIKVLQTLDMLKLNFVYLSTLTDDILAAWREGTWDILVLQLSEVSPTMTGCIQTLAQILEQNAQKQAIIISTNEEHIVSVVKCYLHEMYSQFNDNSLLTHLDLKSQEILLKQRVLFQGFSVILEELVVSEELKEAVDDEALCKLLNKKDILTIGQTLLDDICFYEPRKLIREVYVKVETVLQETDFPTTLAISGEGAHNLHVVGNEHRRCRLVFLNNDPRAHFLELCKLYPDIHWLRKVDDYLMWEQSNGDISTLLSLIDKGKYVIYDAEKLDLMDRTVLIIAVPGMGKSTLFNHLARTLKEIDHTSWVVQINLSKHSELLATILCGNNYDMLMSLLSQSINSKHKKLNLEIALLKHSLEHAGNIKVFIDEFDKIKPEYSNLGKDLLCKLRNTKVSKLFVASRSVMRHVLEQELSLVSFTLTHLQEEQQLSFLLNIWKEKMCNERSDELCSSILDKGHKFGTLLLQHTKTSLKDKEKQFTGIPLHTRMLAEAYYNKLNTFIISGVADLQERLDLLQLYERYVEGKCNVFCEQQKNITRYGDDKENLEDIFMDIHMQCALLVLFSSDTTDALLTNQIKSNIKEYLRIAEEDCEETGIIIEVSNGEPHFIHRIFVEYFSAKWFSENYENNRNILENLLFHPNYDMVRGIFDRILAKESKLHVAILNNDIEKVKSLLAVNVRKTVNCRDQGGRTALHLAAAYGRVSSDSDYSPFSAVKYGDSDTTRAIVEILLSHKDIVLDMTDYVFNWKPVCYAEKVMAWGVVELFLQSQGKLCLIKQNLHDTEYVQSVLSIVSKESHINLMTYLLNNNISVNKMIRFHIYISSQSSKCAPLHIAARYGQLEFVKFLISKGASTTLLDQYGQTPLHLAAEFGKVDVVRYLVETGSAFNHWYAGQLNFKSLMKGCISDIHNKNGESLLHVSASGNYLQVLHYLINSYANITLRDNLGSTALYNANFEGDCEAIKLLVGIGASVMASNNQGRTPLHKAAKVSNIYIIQFLLNEGAHINACTKKGETPLHEAIWEGRTSMLKVVTFLVENGSDVNMKDVNSNMPLHKAAMQNELSVVKYLSTKGKGVALAKYNQDGCTPLCLAAEHGNLRVVRYLVANALQHDINLSLFKAAKAGKHEVVSFLIGVGGDVNFHGENGNTALHESSEKGDLTTVQLLLENGAVILRPDDDGNTPLHKAALHGKIDVVLHLLSQGATVACDNNDGDTALHKAVASVQLYLIESHTWEGGTVKKYCTRDGVAASDLYHHKLDIVKCLVKHLKARDIEFNLLSNKYGESPLHVCARHGRMELMECLVNNGSYYNSCSDHGATPLDEAIFAGNADVINYLVELGASSYADRNRSSIWLNTQWWQYNMFNILTDIIQQLVIEIVFQVT